MTAENIYRYRLINQHCSSQRLGNCEVCKQPVPEVFHQIEERQFASPIDNETHWTHAHCTDYFGHEKCLKSKQR